MLPGSKVALFDFALVRQASLSLQEQLDSFAPAQPANCLTISCQTNLLRNEPRTSDFVLNSSTLGRTAAIMRNGRHVLDIPHFQTGGGESANGRLTSGSRPLHSHFHTAHAVVAGSIGHALAQQITRPSESVMATCVLLNVASTCTIPTGTMRFSFFLKTFFLPAFAAAFAMNPHSRIWSSRSD